VIVLISLGRHSAHPPLLLIDSLQIFSSSRNATAGIFLTPTHTLHHPIQIPAKYGGKYTVTLIPGDGIGAEITSSVKDIFEALNVPVEWEQYDVSGETTGGEALFREAMDSLKRNKVGLKGILYTPIDVGGHNSWNVAMRQQLDIYASVVLCKTLPGVPSRHKNVDFAIIRENTEGEYAGLEHQSYPGVVENLKISTRAKADRIARFAFDFALKNNRKVRRDRRGVLVGPSLPCALTTFSA
jgi:isocitrate dehydrogenase (NAD+)